MSVMMPGVNPGAVNDVGVLYCPMEIIPNQPGAPVTGKAARTRFGMVNVCVGAAAMHRIVATLPGTCEYDCAQMVTLPSCNDGSRPLRAIQVRMYYTKARSRVIAQLGPFAGSSFESIPQALTSVIIRA